MSSKAKFTDITISDYNEKSIVVQGDTRKYKEDLKKLGGKYNGHLKNGPGWIFPKSNDTNLHSFINGGKRLVSEEEAREGEERSKQRAKEWAEKESKTVTKCSPMETSISNLSPILGEYATLVNLVKDMSNNFNRLEYAILMLLDDDQKKQLDVLFSPKPIKKKSVVKNVNRNIKYDSEFCSDDENILEVSSRKRLLSKK